MLIDVSRVHRVPAVQLRHRTEVYEPVHLDGFPQVAGSMSRHPTTNRGDFLQFLLALLVGLAGCHLFCQLRMPFSKQDGGVAGDDHRLQFLLLVSSLRVIDIVEALDFRLDTGLHIKKSLVVHLAIHRRMACGALLHKLREHTSVVGLLPFLRDVVEDTLTLRLTLPVGNDLALVGVDVLLRDGVTLQLTLVQRVQVLYGVAGQFRKRRHRLGQRTTFAYYQFVRTYIDCFLLTDFIEVPRPQHGCRHCAVMLLIERRLYQRPLYGERRRRIEILLAQAAYTLIHAAKVLWMFDAVIHINSSLLTFHFSLLHFSLAFGRIDFFDAHRLLDGA